MQAKTAQSSAASQQLPGICLLQHVGPYMQTGQLLHRQQLLQHKLVRCAVQRPAPQVELAGVLQRLAMPAEGLPLSEMARWPELLLPLAGKWPRACCLLQMVLVAVRTQSK